MTTSDDAVSPVVGLAVQLNALRERVEQAEGTLAGLGQKVADLAHTCAILEALTPEVQALGIQVRELAQTLRQTRKSPAAGDEQDGPPPVARGPWHLLAAETGPDSPLDELRAWVAKVLTRQYGGYLVTLWPNDDSIEVPAEQDGGRRQMPTCWERHPEALAELWTLYVMWDSAFMKPDSPIREAADWHDRLLPGVLRRLAPLFDRCGHLAQAYAPRPS